MKTQKPDVEMFLVLEEENISFDFSTDNYLKRTVDSIFVECGINPESDVPISEQEPDPLLDRAALDKVVFDALGLTEEERKDVYRAVCQLVWDRISRARSV